MLLIHNHFRQLSEFLLEEHVQVKKKSKLNLTEILSVYGTMFRQTLFSLQQRNLGT